MDIPGYYLPPNFRMPEISMRASLVDTDLEKIRQIVREELDAALQRLMIGEQRLLADITEPQEQDEQEEIAAVLATMTADEWETLVQRVRERKREQRAKE